MTKHFSRAELTKGRKLVPVTIDGITVSVLSVEANLKRTAERLEKIRADAGGRPLSISSGYRSPQHPIEARKSKGPGIHCTGQAVDIHVGSSGERHRLIKYALKHGATRLGIAPGFLHVDWWAGSAHHPAGVTFLY